MITAEQFINAAMQVEAHAPNFNIGTLIGEFKKLNHPDARPVVERLCYILNTLEHIEKLEKFQRDIPVAQDHVEQD